MANLAIISDALVRSISPISNNVNWKYKLISPNTKTHAHLPSLTQRKKIKLRLLPYSCFWHGLSKLENMNNQSSDIMALIKNNNNFTTHNKCSLPNSIIVNQNSLGMNQICPPLTHFGDNTWTIPSAILSISGLWHDRPCSRGHFRLTYFFGTCPCL